MVLEEQVCLHTGHRLVNVRTQKRFRTLWAVRIWANKPLLVPNVSVQASPSGEEKEQAKAARRHRVGRGLARRWVCLVC